MMAHFLMQAIAGAARRRATTGASPYVFADDFEAYADAAEATASNNWVSTGTPTFGYSTSPLQGSRSLMINGLPTATSKSFAAGDDPWIYFRFRVNDTAFGQTIITLLGSDGSTVAVLSLLAGGKLSAKIGVGTSTDTSPGAVTGNTNYSVWLSHSTTSGKLDVYTSLSETRPDEPSLSDLGSASTATKVRFGPVASSKTLIWDKLRVSASEIGSDPA